MINVQHVVDDYQSGKSTIAIAKKHRITQKSAARILRRANIPMRWPPIISTSTLMEIAKAYRSGEAIYLIERRYHTNWKTIKTRLLTLGLSLRPSDRVGAEERDRIARLYQSGTSQLGISRLLKRDQATVNRCLRLAGIDIRHPGEFHRRYKLNECAFETMSPPAAYWIGFLMADGGVCEQKGTAYTLSVALSSVDHVHLVRLKDFLGTTTPISCTTVNGRSYSRLTIGSMRLCASLSRYGVVPRKSLTARVIGLESDRDFWRGVIDGDGTIGIQRQTPTYVLPVIKLYGSRWLLEQFAQFCKSFTATKAKLLRGKGNDCWQWGTTGGHAIRLIAQLYRVGDIALQRKACVAARLLSSYSHHLSA